jgi:hypothetical protein
LTSALMRSLAAGSGVIASLGGAASGRVTMVAIVDWGGADGGASASGVDPHAVVTASARAARARAEEKGARVRRLSLVRSAGKRGEEASAGLAEAPWAVLSRSMTAPRLYYGSGAMASPGRGPDSGLRPAMVETWAR